MKKSILIILLIFLVKFSFAQERFYNLYEGWTCCNVVENENVYNVWGKGNNISGAYQVIRQSISFEGNYLSTNNAFFIEPYLSTHTFRRPDMLVTKGRSSYFSGYVKHGDNAFYPLFMKYDENTQDTVFSRIYTDLLVDQLIFYTSCYRTNNVYVLASTYDNNDHINMSFHKIDTLGNVLFSQQYYPTSNHPYADIRYPLQIAPVNDGGFILTFEEPITTSSVINQDAYCMKVDSLGNEEWRCALGHHDTLNYRPFVFPMENGNFLFTYSDPLIENTTDPDFSPMSNDSSTIWLGEMSSTGQVLWKHNLSHDIVDMSGVYYVNDVYQDEQNNIYLAGTMTYYDDMSFLIKINAQHQAVWEQRYSAFPENADAGFYYTKIYGLTATSDGGFIMAGEYASSDSEMFPGGVQSSLVIKVDECGCLEEGCNPDCFTSNAQVQYIRMNQLEIFPNPASDFVRIHFDAQAGWLRIFNQKAQLCIDKTYHADTELDLSKLRPGLYTVRLNADGKFYWGQFVKK